MIGGRVLDSSAATAFATGTSVYAAALVWTAVEEGIVLVVPATAVSAAWSRLASRDRPALEVLLRLPVTMVDDLTADRALAAAELAADPADGHALLCARDRGWPLVTADPDRYRAATGVEIESLP